ERALVTGIRGCLGAWTARALLDDGIEVVGFDLGDASHRLDLVLGEDAGRVDVVRGDITDRAVFERALDEHAITRVIHLAALQVPACRENPALGAQVNVLGTMNVLEAVRVRLDRIPGVVLASSAAVYGPSDPSPAPESHGGRPSTHYGVFKLANEGNARIAWAEGGVASISIRPYVVYGLGRDQGLTSGPTLAMEAAVQGEEFTIGYGGEAQYDYAPDVGYAFARASAVVREGAIAANFPGAVASIRQVVEAIEAALPAARGRIGWDDVALPFPARLEATALEAALGALPKTSLAAGVAATIERFGA
ncbi:MAG: NAD(P)-dependent oxidoreductase, partial [Gaiellaceae bacterium]